MPPVYCPSGGFSVHNIFKDSGKDSKMNIVIDEEFRKLIPPLTPEEFAGLKQSLMSEGCRDPLVLWGDILCADVVQ